MKNALKNIKILLVLLVLAGTVYVSGIPQNLISKAAENISSSQKDFSTIVPVDTGKPVYSFSVSGSAYFAGDKSLIRLILVDTQGNEYLIYETYSLLTDRYSFALSNSCEETCVLDAVIPQHVRIEGYDASFDIKKFSYATSVQEIRSRIGALSISDRSLAIKREKDAGKIQKLNENIKKAGLKWTAGETSVSTMTYAQKKKLFSNPDGKPLERLPNLQGFEFYTGGVFEIGRPPSSPTPTIPPTPINTAFPLSWDWRNRHGQNWMTPVKDQETYPTCWAFGTIGAFEAFINLWYNQHLDVDLSEQSLINCQNDPRVYDNQCIEGDACILQNIGAVDEICVPYVGDQGICESGCANYQDKVWKNYDHRTYITESWAQYSQRRIPINKSTGDEKIKEGLIQHGPMKIDGVISAHSMVLVGYTTDTIDQRPIFMVKNSWGGNWGQAGYANIKVDPALYNIVTGITATYYVPPVINQTNIIATQCVDNDNDGYCNWGISEIKPNTCPSKCKPVKDCNDSDPSLGEFNIYYECMPIANSHMVCNKGQCVKIKGQGYNECRNSGDCGRIAP